MKQHSPKAVEKPQSITFTCEVITPMFLHGADGKTPELRAPSIKGALRFWWRAIHGHLPIKDLRTQEAEIFGGTESDKEQGRSKLLLRIKQIKLPSEESPLLPHKRTKKEQSYAQAFKKSQHFELIASLQKEVKGFDLDKLKALVILTATLGGFGKRARRGMGSINISNIDGLALSCSSLEDVFQHLNVLNPNHFDLKSSAIESTFKNAAAYPWIQKIELGVQHNDDYVHKIAQTTHDKKGKNLTTYSASLGDGTPRFASPIYVSLLQVNSELRPVITTLKAVPPSKTASETLQNEFKQAILS